MGNSSSQARSAHDSFHPTEGDVVALRITLLNLLPRELVDIIIDYAGYWPLIQAERRLRVTATAMDQLDGPAHADWCYLVTPRLAREHLNDDETEYKRPRRICSVTFRTLSHDQGWGGPPPSEMEQHGPYHGAFSWFEAVIVRPSEEYPNAPWWLENALDLPEDLGHPAPSQTVLSEANAVQVGPGSKRWFVQSNQTANDKYKEHVVTWSIDDVPVIDHGNLVEFDSLQGHVGMEREFLDLLKPGDRIALMARAMFPAWENTVQSATIQVAYSM